MFVEAFQKLPLSELTEKGTLTALKLGKEYLPKLFKGIGAKTMGCWAGNAGKVAGPIVQVGLFVWSMIQAHREAAAERQRIALRAQAIDDAVNGYVNDLRSGYRRLLADVIEQVFLPLDDWLQVQVQATADLEQRHDQDRRALAQARSSLRA